MPEVVYMKNDQNMELIEIPKKIVDDDMMYFCNQDDMEDDSCGSLFEGFDGNVTRNSSADSGIDQPHSEIMSERVSARGNERRSADECRRVGEKMDRLKLRLERKIGFTTESEIEGQGIVSGNLRDIDNRPHVSPNGRSGKVNKSNLHISPKPMSLRSPRMGEDSIDSGLESFRSSGLSNNVETPRQRKRPADQQAESLMAN